MAEISPIASARLARLRENFLTMPPADQLAFTQSLRQRRERPVPLKKVSKGKANAKKKAVEETSIKSPSADAVADPGPASK